MPRKRYRPKKSILSREERARRARVARQKLLPAGIKAAGKRGFRGTLAKIKGKPGVRSPKRLAGWLKYQAYRRGQLSPEHAYVGRKGYRKRRK